jgi:HK97 family phage prohead protease
MNRLELKAQFSVEDSGLITGIAWPFGSPDRIGDMVAPGAFKGAVSPLPMLAFHDPKQPVGVWNTITEKSDGLHVTGKLLVDDVMAAREMRALVREGAVRGLSIGYQTKKAITRKCGGRLIQALDLAEISLVTVAMHPGAKVTGLKSFESAAASIADAINRAAAALKRRT